MFIAALFTVARTWRQPRYSLKDEWIRKLWNIYTVDYYKFFLQCAFDRFVHANSQLERFFFSFLSFFNQMVIISSSLVSVCGTIMFSNAETSCLALFLMFSRHSKYAILGQRSKSNKKRNQSLGQSPTKSLNTGCMFMLFHAFHTYK